MAKSSDWSFWSSCTLLRARTERKESFESIHVSSNQVVSEYAHQQLAPSAKLPELFEFLRFELLSCSLISLVAPRSPATGRSRKELEGRVVQRATPPAIVRYVDVLFDSDLFQIRARYHELEQLRHGATSIPLRASLVVSEKIGVCMRSKEQLDVCVRRNLRRNHSEADVRVVGSPRVCLLALLGRLLSVRWC